MPFETVRYAYDVSSPESVVTEMGETPEMYVVFGKMMYWADESGYVMMHPLSGEWSDLSEMGEMPDVPGDDRNWAVNAKWYDESEYGALVPEAVERCAKRVARALTEMHRIADES